MASSGQRLVEFSNLVRQLNEQEDKLLAERIKKMSVVQEITARHMNAEIRRTRLQAVKKRYVSVDTCNDPLRTAAADYEAFFYRKTPSYVMSCGCRNCKRHWHMSPSELSAKRKRNAQKRLAWTYYYSSSSKSTFSGTFQNESSECDSLLNELDLNLSLSSVDSNSGSDMIFQRKKESNFSRDKISACNSSTPMDRSATSRMTDFSLDSDVLSTPNSTPDTGWLPKLLKDQK